MFEDNLKEFELQPLSASEFLEWALRSSDPLVRHAMSLHSYGKATREEALLIALWHLAKFNAELQQRLYERMVREPVQMIVPVYVPGGG